MREAMKDYVANNRESAADDRAEAESKKHRERLQESATFRKVLVKSMSATAWAKGYAAGKDDEVHWAMIQTGRRAPHTNPYNKEQAR